MNLASMIPGMGKAMIDIYIEDDAFKHIEAIIHSMTRKERADASIIDGSRRKRISNGSGTSIQEVNRLLKQFADTRKMMKMVSQGGNMRNALTQAKGRR